ncbi:hypothetical protein HP550_10270 [Cellulomonas humilata]|uniref:AbiEi antitoxin C-terminal domain-containing protein n=1 Tax=Cellulomonas humilata TaxID=144055 RepID=A0A7Y6A0X6_9CELL|nr:hypothetical protein [Cellulomonas humilata]NUU17630.1 hypothetical protein [Cellulomonas humilata]
MSTRLDEFRAVPPVLPRTVSRDDVGAAAWFGLLRDGVVRHVWGDVAIAADLVDTPVLRAVALAPLVPARGVVGRRAAAWVHTGRYPPVRVDVLVGTGGRRTDPHPERVAAEAILPTHDVVRVGALRVTTVQRTGADLARLLPHDEALSLLRGLSEVGFDPEHALAQLVELGGQRGVRQARTLLRSL